MSRAWGIIGMGAVLAGAGALGAAAESGSKTSPATQPAAGEASTRPAVVLPLVQAPRIEIGRYSLAQVQEMFPPFKHEPFETAGYNHLTLPFLYRDRTGRGNAAEAQAFAFLLSFALDWGPGCYCSRHAYFCFKRARRYMEPLAEAYDPATIALAAKDWESTHAVGGTLTRQAAGYSGTLMIYGPDGLLLRKTEFTKVRGFFELLGDMSVEGLTVLGHAPGEELARHLRAKQCEHPQSLIDLGKAAFADERSDEEFGLYDAILQRDPNFAAVRYWRANQMYWTDSNRRAYALEKAKALESCPMQAALWDLGPTECPDPALAARFADWVGQAERLVGRDSPLVLGKHLEMASGGKVALAPLLDRATAAAARYPNDYWFLNALARAYGYGGPLEADCDMAFSLALTASRNLYLTGIGNKDDALRKASRSAWLVGRYGLAAQVLLPTAARRLKEGAERGARWEAELLGEMLFDMGWFDESLHWYRIAFKGEADGSEKAATALVGAAVAAAHAGRADVVRQILRDHRDLLEQHGATGVLEGYLDLLAGKPHNHKAVWKRPEPRPSWLERHLVLVTLQSDLLFGKDARWSRADAYCWNELKNRPFRILAHRLYQAHPHRSADCFYDAMEWLYDDDPFTHEAVAQWRARVKSPTLPDPDELLAALKDYEPLRRPVPDPSREQEAWKLISDRSRYRAGAFASGVRRLVATGRPDKARELALRFLHAATDAQDYRSRTYANHLIHHLERVRRGLPGMVGADDL